MGKVIGFPQSPLSPFLGTWVLDPLSVSRNKAVKHALGDEGLKKLWGFASMEERAAYLAGDAEMAARYATLRRTGNDSHLEVTPQTLTFTRPPMGVVEAKTSVFPVLRVAAEGRKVVVHTVNGAERGNQPIAYVLRFSKRWLLVSERYFGRAAQLYPRSPVHRYSAAE